MSRIFRGLLLVVAVGSGVAIAGRGLAADKPCMIATKGDSPVAKACTEGGLIEAKRTMRDLVKQAKKAGTKFECDDCHKNDTTYELTTEGRNNFKKLLAAVEGKK